MGLTHSMYFSMKFKHLFILFISLTITIGYGQSKKTEIADRFFDLYKFQEAIKAYKKALKRDRKNAIYIYKKLGDAYSITSQPEEAEKWYAKAVYDTDNEPIYYYRYAMALRQNKKYDESVKWMTIYKQKSGMSDSRLEEFFKELDIVEKVKREGNKAQIYAVSVNSPFSEYGAVYYKDDKIAYTTNNIKANGKRKSSYDNLPFTDLNIAQRIDDNDFEEVSKFPSVINTNYHESSPTFNSDYTVMFFTRNNMNPQKKNNLRDYNLKIFRSKKQPDGKWSMPEEVHFNSDAYNCAHACLSKDNKTLYFASDMPGTKGKSDIFKVKVNKDWTLGKPENLGKDINTEGTETFPYVDQHGNLFFSSDGHAGLGGLDIFVAFYTSSGEFFMLKNMGLPYNSSKDDFAFNINDNHDEGFISSNRLGGQGYDDIYLFRPMEMIRPFIYFVGHTKDNNNFIIPNALVELYSNGKLISKKASMFNGRVTFLLDPEKEYEIRAHKKGYQDDIIKFNTFNLKKSRIEKDLILKQFQKIKACVADYDTKEAIDSVEVKIYGHNNKDEQYVLYTKPNGCIDFKVPNELQQKEVSYEFEFRKKGYLSKRYNYKKKLEKDTMNWIKPHKQRIFMHKLKLNPIYFDLDKWDIRPDAAAELDKIVDLLNKFPKIKLSMESHTDSRQTKAYNNRLSQRRAQATMQYLIDHGINPKRLKARGFGESRLVNHCSDGVKCTEEEHQMNRRTEFMIISDEDDE